MYERASGEVVSLELFLETAGVALVVCVIVSQDTLQETMDSVDSCQRGHQVPGVLLRHCGQGEETTAPGHLRSTRVCNHQGRGGGGGERECREKPPNKICTSSQLQGQ